MFNKPAKRVIDGKKKRQSLLLKVFHNLIHDKPIRIPNTSNNISPETSPVRSYGRHMQIKNIIIDESPEVSFSEQTLTISEDTQISPTFFDKPCEKKNSGI